MPATACRSLSRSLPDPWPGQYNFIQQFICYFCSFVTWILYIVYLMLLAIGLSKIFLIPDSVANIFDHTFRSSMIILSSKPYVFVSPDIVHPSDAGPASGSLSMYILSSTILVMFAGSVRCMCSNQPSHHLVTWNTIWFSFALFQTSSLLIYTFQLIPWIERSILIFVLFNWCFFFFLITVEPLLYDHPQNHIDVVV